MRIRPVDYPKEYRDNPSLRDKAQASPFYWVKKSIEAKSRLKRLE